MYYSRDKDSKKFSNKKLQRYFFMFLIKDKAWHRHIKKIAKTGIYPILTTYREVKSDLISQEMLILKPQQKPCGTP